MSRTKLPLSRRTKTLVLSPHSWRTSQTNMKSLITLFFLFLVLYGFGSYRNHVTNAKKPNLIASQRIWIKSHTFSRLLTALHVSKNILCLLENNIFFLPILNNFSKGVAKPNHFKSEFETILTSAYSPDLNTLLGRLSTLNSLIIPFWSSPSTVKETTFKFANYQKER